MTVISVIIFLANFIVGSLPPLLIFSGDRKNEKKILRKFCEKKHFLDLFSHSVIIVLSC